VYREQHPTHMLPLVRRVRGGPRMDIYKVKRLLGHAKVVTTVLGPRRRNACADTCLLSRRAHVALNRQPPRA
jgi:hypothetical protein